MLLLEDVVLLTPARAESILTSIQKGYHAETFGGLFNSLPRHLSTIEYCYRAYSTTLPQ